jgi:Calpain family cysteine protease
MHSSPLIETGVRLPNFALAILAMALASSSRIAFCDCRRVHALETAQLIHLFRPETTVKKPRKVKSRRPQIETLERRDVMTGATAALSGGVLTITGTTGAEQVSLMRSGTNISIVGLTASQLGSHHHRHHSAAPVAATIRTWSTSQVSSIVIDLKGGGDAVSLDSVSNGGTQSLGVPVTVRSGTGSEVVHLWDHHDVTMTGAGHTLIAGANNVVTVDGQTQSWSNPTPTPTPTPSVTSNWFDTHITDAALRSLGHSLYTDGLINRSDMIALLRNTEDGGIIDSTELTDLKAIVANTSLFGTLSYVDQLAADIVNGNVANAKYQGQPLGYLAAGTSTAKMENLVGKWFLGLDHPVASGDAYGQYSSYRQFSGSLFVNGATYTDIKQGYLGDCYFMSTIGEVALRNPSAITNMFIVNGDGTYTVKFFNNGQATYVTVDSYLPTDSAGRLIYAGLGATYNNSGNELWTALAEKAYVQLNELGWERSGLSGNGQNSYSAINGGYIFAAQGQVTGQSTVAFAMTSAGTSFNAFVTAWNQGKSIGFASKSNPASGSGVVGGHAYAVVGYNSVNQTVTLFNPWGVQYPQLTLSWSQIQSNFDYFDRTA